VGAPPTLAPTVLQQLKRSSDTLLLGQATGHLPPLPALPPTTPVTPLDVAGDQVPPPGVSPTPPVVDFYSPPPAAHHPGYHPNYPMGYPQKHPPGQLLPYEQQRPPSPLPVPIPAPTQGHPGRHTPGDRTLDEMGVDPATIINQMPPGISQEALRGMTIAEIDHLANVTRDTDSRGKKRAELVRAMIPQTITGVDDRGQTVHPARFLPASLSPPFTWWHHVPARLEIITTGLQLKHLGMENQVSPRTIELCHDRTKPLELKQFLRINMGVLNKPVATKQVYSTHRDSMAITSDLQWREATKMQQVMEGLQAYVAIMRQLFPFDYGPPNIVTTMFNWHFFSFRSDQVRAAREVINSAMARNAQLAEESNTPLSIADLDDFVPRILRQMGGVGQCTMPDSMPPGLFSAMPSFNRQDDRRPMPMREPTRPPPWRPSAGPGKGPGKGPGTGPPAGAARFTAVFLGTQELCGQFNSPSGCPRATAAGSTSCTTPDGKRTLYHRCSVTERNGRVCGKDHPKPNH
jgi:hypothetical protein